VNITLDSSGSHPQYEVKVYGGEDKVWESRHRFAAFRDLNEKIINTSPGVLSAKFPPTFASSAYGIKLSAAQLSERRALLQLWLQDVIDSYDDLEEAVQERLFQFINVDNTHFQYGQEEKLNKKEFARAASASTISNKDNGKESPDPKRTHSNKEMSTLTDGRGKPTRRKSALAFIGGKSEEPQSKSFRRKSTQEAELTEQRRIAEESERLKAQSMLSVMVSRGSVVGGHPTYETMLTYDRNQRPHIVAKQFKDYRTLALDLSLLGISSDVTAGDNEPEQKSSTNLDLPPFPRTFRRSSLGIKLSENDLMLRCQGLDRWMRGLLVAYPKLSPEAQVHVNNFLHIDATATSEGDHTRFKAILQSLLKGWVRSDSTFRRDGDGNGKTSATQPVETVASKVDSSSDVSSSKMMGENPEKNQELQVTPSTEVSLGMEKTPTPAGGNRDHNSDIEWQEITPAAPQKKPPAGCVPGCVLS